VGKCCDVISDSERQDLKQFAPSTDMAVANVSFIEVVFESIWRVTRNVTLILC